MKRLHPAGRPAAAAQVRPAPAPAPPPARDSLVAGALALAATLALTPAVAGDRDAGEFTLALARWGVAHPTGYPLHTLLGGAFVHLAHALGARWAWAANAWSAVGAGVAIGLLHALAARLAARAGLPPRAASIGAALAAVLLAANPVWTEAATQAEVHTWHVAWLAGATLALLAAFTPRPVRARDAAAWGALAGIGLAHHVTSVLTSGPYALALLVGLARQKRGRPVLLAAACAGALSPLASYGWVAWRAFHPAIAQWPALGANWASVLRHVTGAEYRIYLGHFAPRPEELRAIVRDVLPTLAPAGALLLAWAAFARSAPGALRAGIAGAFFATLAYVVGYGVPDPSAYFLGPLALALAVTPAALAPLARARAPRRALGLAGAALAMLALVAGVLVTLARDADFRAQDARLRALWREVPITRGFLAWANDRVALLRGYQVLDGEAPGLEILHPVELTQTWPRHEFQRRFGFDPVSRPRIAAAAAVARPRDVQELSRLLARVVPEEINARSPLPVAIFDLDAATVTVLPKSAPDSIPPR